MQPPELTGARVDTCEHGLVFFVATHRRNDDLDLVARSNEARETAVELFERTAQDSAEELGKRRRTRRLFRLLVKFGEEMAFANFNYDASRARAFQRHAENRCLVVGLETPACGGHALFGGQIGERVVAKAAVRSFAVLVAVAQTPACERPRRACAWAMMHAVPTREPAHVF
jgi:hypothetical protein